MRKRIIAILLAVFVIVGVVVPGIGPAANADDLTWGKPGYFAVDDYCYIKWRVNAPSTVEWTGAQGNIYDENGNRLTLCHVNFKKKGKYLVLDYNVKRDMTDPNTGRTVTLQPGKSYYYMFQVKIGSKWYNSPRYKFKVMTVEERAKKFAKDDRWKNGISWGSRKTKYNTGQNTTGARAYADDYLKYMYGLIDLRTGKKYTSAKSIKAGDIIHLKGGNGHWVVVLKRYKDGRLRTAEGNISKKVKITSNKYYIKNGKLCGCGKKATSNGKVNLSFDYGYRYYGYTYTKAEKLVKYAKNFIGCPYVYGATGPNSFDCSGFVYYLFKSKFNISLNTGSSAYWNNPTAYGTVVKESEALPGDVVSWAGHVGLYIGNGQVINALNENQGVCIIKVKEYMNSNKTLNPPHRYIRIKGMN